MLPVEDIHWDAPTMAELLTFVLGDIFGILTLMVGIGVGFWLGKLWQPSGKPVPEEQREPPPHYREQLAGMLQFTSHFTGDLARHIELMESLKQKLGPSETPDDGDGASPRTVQLIAEMTAANQRLKQRLESAEATLKLQTQELEERLSEARTDSLTGLLNRRAFDEECSKWWSLWQRKRSPFCVLLLDIDHFKAVNDRYGHAVGDAVLQEVAERLHAVMRHSDYLARIGGEEMAILLPETEWDDVISVANKVLQAVRSGVVRCGDIDVSVTVSCGIMSAVHAESAEGLYQGADAALYAAKSAGRDRGFVNDGESLVPIDRFDPSGTEMSRATGTSEEPTRSGERGESTARLAESDLNAAAEELRMRLLQISQGI